MDKKPFIILTGPTSVGKTALSIKLAKAVNGEIISADSMQVYKYMDIGTAKITPEEMEGVPHYLIDEFTPDEEFNVMIFQQYAKAYMEDIYQKGKIPILVGGTGFYIQALLYDINFTVTKESEQYRQELEALVEEKGGEYLHDLLKTVDPESAASIHPNNSKRVIRAYEYYQQTGEKFSLHNKEQQQNESPYNHCYFVLHKDRESLYNTIDYRVDQMVEKGLVREVQCLLDMGYQKDLVSMQGLGYKEIIPYLEGQSTLEDAVYILKRDTRHFAKRQLTWFRRERDVTWVDKDQFDNDETILKHLIDELKKNKVI